MYRVLYVDDDPHLLDVARMFLEETREIVLETAPLATTALNLPSLPFYDAIVADYEMPKMDGIAFLKKIRADHGDIPFILFTGKGREEIVIEAINNGADFYLQKGGDPVAQFAELAHKIKNAVERRRAVAALKTSERKYRHLYRHALVGLFETKLSDATIVACNQKYCDLAGFSSIEEAIGQSVIPLYRNPADRTRVSERLRSRGFVENCEFQFVNRKTGQPFWGQFSARMDCANDVAEGTIIDVTERKLAVENLRMSEEKYRLLTENTTDIMYALDIGGHITHISPRIERYGYLPEQLVGHHISELIAEEDLDDVMDEFKKSLATGRPTRTIFRVRKGFEQALWFEDNGGVVHDEDGRPVGIAGVLRDITERRQIEDALRESEETFRSLVVESAEGILLVDESGTVIEWNPALETITGIPRHEAIGMPYIGILTRTFVPGERTPERVEKIQRYMENALSTGKSGMFGRRIASTIHHQDGSRRTIQQTVFPIRTVRGFRVGSITRDITGQH